MFSHAKKVAQAKQLAGPRQGERFRQHPATRLDACCGRVGNAFESPQRCALSLQPAVQRSSSMLPQDNRAPRPHRPRVVLHVDLDAFFVQVERKLNPTLIGA